ncbi:MAG TPA: M28 family metallopeptidase [Edaphobacter sp.]|nr:M28 family metallopeptidase [Edaphobacter sp.]
MTTLKALAYLPLLAAFTLPAQTASPSGQTTPSNQVFGYRDFTQQAKWDAAFLPVPSATLAGEHLKTLTAEPHWASSPEDYKTALYVAAKFKEAGLETSIVPYKVLLNKPANISIEAFDESGKKLMSGPTREHVDPNKFGGDPFQDNPRIFTAFNGFSPSGDVTAPVVYANYGTHADFKKLAQLGVSVKGKIVIVRYGKNFRGVKVYIAQQYGAKGVLIYSDPADDGYFRGDPYPKGPYRPATGVQRGSVQFLPIYPGDPETPGIASTPDLPDSKRIKNPTNDIPSIPANPLSYKDAAPILKALDGPDTPRNWQGALPFTYHLGGTNKVTVHMHLQQDYALRTIWDVIGTINGTDPAQKNNWVIAGNHRDAWVYGAVDPVSGTAAMLEAVHGVGELLKQGWRPKRGIIFASWDAEEEGLIGSTEWAEAHGNHLGHAVAYFNTDVAVSGPNFTAAAVPSLKQFLREVTMRVPSPKGGNLYDQWRMQQHQEQQSYGGTHSQAEASVDNLGSGSDYTPFIQHFGVPSTDVGSVGRYGVYHSTFDDYTWFTKFGDPNFLYEQQMARVFGLEVLHMADADVLPYDYEFYGKEVVGYITNAQKKAAKENLKLDFTAALAAAQRFATAGAAIRTVQNHPPADTATLNQKLRAAEEALLNSAGLPQRPWYKHVIYAPGIYTGYEAVVIPGVNEAIDNNDASLAQSQLAALTDALNRSASALESAAK